MKMTKKELKKPKKAQKKVVLYGEANYKCS